MDRSGVFGGGGALLGPKKGDSLIGYLPFLRGWVEMLGFLEILDFLDVLEILAYLDFLEISEFPRARLPKAD